MVERLKVLLVERQKLPREFEFPYTANALHGLFGDGLAATNSFGDEVVIIFSEEARQSERSLNRAVIGADGQVVDVIAGPFAVVERDGENFKSLSPALMAKYNEIFLYPEWFSREGDEIIITRLPLPSVPEGHHQSTTLVPQELAPKRFHLPQTQSDEYYTSKYARAMLDGSMRIWEVPKDYRHSMMFSYAIRYARHSALAYTELNLIEKVLLDDILRTGDDGLKRHHANYFEDMCIRPFAEEPDETSPQSEDASQSNNDNPLTEAKTPASEKKRLSATLYAKLSIYLLCVALNVPWILLVVTGYLKMKQIAFSFWYPILAAGFTLILGILLAVVISNGQNEQFFLDMEEFERKCKALERD